MMRPLAFVLVILLGLATELPAALRGTKADKLPRSDEPAKPNAETSPPIRRQRIFGIGIRFEPSGTLAGVALKLVLPDSPAFRAGLLAGCFVSEINGEATVGRSGEDCIRMILNGGNSVKIKFLDPAMRERTITIDKQWLTVPEYLEP